MNLPQVYAGIMGLSGSELVIILLIVMVLFGASRLPQLGSSLGSAIKNFKKGFSEDEPQPNKDANATAAPPQQLDADKKKV